MAYANILFAIAGGVARLTLNRPDRLNSFNDAMHAEVRDALALLRIDESVRVLVLTGAGRGFCAGQDLGDRAVAPGDATPDLGASIERNYRPLVLGAAVVADAGRGGGQRRRRRRRRQPRARLRPRDRGEERELHPGVREDRAHPRFRRHVFPAAPRRRRRGRWGSRCWATSSAPRRPRPGVSSGARSTTRHSPTEVDALAQKLAAAPTRALAAIKATLRASARNTLEAQLDLERDVQRELGGSADYREGVAAFLAKRPPQFRGR